MDGVGDPRRRRPSGARVTLLIAVWLGLGAAPPPGYVEQHTPWTEPLCLTVEAKQTVPFAWDPPELVPDGAVWIRYDVRVDDQVVVSGWPWPAYAHIAPAGNEVCVAVRAAILVPSGDGPRDPEGPLVPYHVRVIPPKQG